MSEAQAAKNFHAQSKEVAMNWELGFLIVTGLFLTGGYLLIRSADKKYHQRKLQFIQQQLQQKKKAAQDTTFRDDNK